MLLCYGGECGPLWPCSAWAVLPGANPECRVCLCTCNAIFLLRVCSFSGQQCPRTTRWKQLCELGQGYLSVFPFVLKKGPTAFNKDCCCLGDVASCFLMALQLEENQIFLPFTAVCVLSGKYEVQGLPTVLETWPSEMLCGYTDVQHRTCWSHCFLKENKSALNLILPPPQVAKNFKSQHFYQFYKKTTAVFNIHV